MWRLVSQLGFENDPSNQTGAPAYDQQKYYLRYADFEYETENSNQNLAHFQKIAIQQIYNSTDDCSFIVNLSGTRQNLTTLNQRLHRVGIKNAELIYGRPCTISFTGNVTDEISRFILLAAMFDNTLNHSAKLSNSVIEKLSDTIRDKIQKWAEHLPKVEIKTHAQCDTPQKAKKRGMGNFVELPEDLNTEQTLTALLEKGESNLKKIRTSLFQNFTDDDNTTLAKTTSQQQTALWAPYFSSKTANQTNQTQTTNQTTTQNQQLPEKSAALTQKHSQIFKL